MFLFFQVERYVTYTSSVKFAIVICLKIVKKPRNGYLLTCTKLGK